MSVVVTSFTRQPRPLPDRRAPQDRPRCGPRAGPGRPASPARRGDRRPRGSPRRPHPGCEPGPARCRVPAEWRAAAAATLPLPQAQRDPGPALPHDERQVFFAGLTGHDLHVLAIGAFRLQARADLRDRDAFQAGSENDEMGIAGVDEPGGPRLRDRSGQRPIGETGLSGVTRRRPISTDTSAQPGPSWLRSTASRKPASVSMYTSGPLTSPVLITARAKQRRPFPLVSARLPSALRSSMRTSPPNRAVRKIKSPSAPTPVWRSHSARANSAR